MKNLFLSSKCKTIAAKLCRGFLDLLFPENLYCICCGDCIEAKSRIHGICDKCAKEIHWINDNPFRSSMDEFSFDELISCCIYGYFPRQIIHKFKLGGCRYIAKPLGKLMADRVKMFCGSSCIFDAICFMPSSKEKISSRGFNQAQLLAKEISEELSIPLYPFLIKPHETPSMRLSSGVERRTFPEGFFEINNKTKSPEGLNVLIVDDVLTTGSTAGEAARMLKLAGVKSVTVLVFASSSGNRNYYEDEEDSE